MGFKKRYRRKSKKFRRKQKTLAKKLSKLSKFVYKTVERYQTIDVNNPAEVISDQLWGYAELSRMKFAAGVGNDERRGNCVTAENINFRVMIEDWQAGLTGRLIIVQYPNLVTSLGPNNASMFLQFPTPGSASTYGTDYAVQDEHVIMSPYKVAGTTKYKILYDKTFGLPKGDVTSSSPDGSCLRFNVNINKKTCPKFNDKIEYLAGTTATSAYKNIVAAYWRMTDMDALAAPTKDFRYIYRMTYRDS